MRLAIGLGERFSPLSVPQIQASLDAVDLGG